MTTSAGGDVYAAARLWAIPPEKAFVQPLVQEGEVLSLGFSGDGQTLVSGTGEGSVQALQHVDTGRSFSFAPGHKEGVAVVAVGPDTDTLHPAASEDTTVRLWERATGRLLQTLPHRNRVTTAAFSPDSQAVLTGEASHPIQLWRVEDGKPLGKPFIEPEVCSVVWLSTQPGAEASRCPWSGSSCGIGRQVACCTLWNPGRPFKPLIFCPTETKILIVCGGFAQVWDTETNQLDSSPLFQPEGRHSSYSS